MIRTFGTLYAGHIDLPEVGFQAPAVNSRRFSNDQLATVFDKALAIAQVMDKNDFDIMWLAEHHFQPEGYECIPNLLMLAMYLAPLTARLRIGCGFNIGPMWHPLRLAEDFATADILTKGRVIFGVGRGYHSREVETFGAPFFDQDANRDLFEEQVDVIYRAFTEESFSHQGKYYTIPPRIPYRGYELEKITLVPRPRSQPVEWWQPVISATPRGLDFMAKRGIKGFTGGGAAPGGTSGKTVLAWQQALARAGRETELGTDLGIGFSLHIADTEEQAIKEATPYFEENMKMFAPIVPVHGLSDEQLAALGDPAKATRTKYPSIRDGIAAGQWLCGPPERIIERLMEVQELYPGLETINVGPVVGTPQHVITEQLAWFGKEVIPAFRQQAKKGVAVAAGT